MEAMILIIIQVVLLISPSKHKAAASGFNTTLPGCPKSCGGVDIPYPFGIGPKCAMPGFELNCSSTNGTSTPYLGNLTILNISLSSGQARVNMPVSYQCYGNSTTSTNSNFSSTVDWTDTPFQLNPEKNILRVIGCNALSILSLGNKENSFLGVTGCAPVCDSLQNLTNGNCSGIGCCQATIPQGSNYFLYSFSDMEVSINSSISYNFNRCGYALLMEDTDFFVNTSYITTDELVGQNMSVVIDWAIGNTSCNKSPSACKSDNSICLNSSTSSGYLCNCSDGYQGNPYLQGGCQDIDECTNQNPCSMPAKCHNFQGGYSCSCPTGRRIKHSNNNECELNLALVLGTLPFVTNKIS